MLNFVVELYETMFKYYATLKLLKDL